MRQFDTTFIDPRMRNTVRQSALITILFAVLSTQVGGVDAAEDDPLFLSAREAFQQRDTERMNQAAARLQNHVLWPYVAYWQLKMSDPPPGPAVWQQFLAGQPESLVTQRARADLIRTVAKAEDWAGVEREFAAFELDDVDIRCLDVKARLALRNPEAMQEARALWAQPATQGDACTELFEQLIRNRTFVEDDVWVRIRAHLEQNSISAARNLFNYLGPSARPAKRQWDAVVANPTKYLQQKNLALKSRAEREIALFALYRTALSLPELAHERWVQIKARFPEQERAYGWAQLASAGAFKHRPEAVAWFKEARAVALSEKQTGWKVRGAIRTGQWDTVADTIDGMSDKDRDIATWRYWRARAYQQAGKPAQAQALLAPLATEHHFYGQLAAEEMGTPQTSLLEPVTVTEEDVQAIAQHPGLRRALKLFELDLRYEAVLEWRWNIRRMDDRQLLASSELARRAGWFDRAIDSAERTKQAHNFRLRYPLPYREVFSAYSGRQGIDEAFVYGLVRQESRFSPQIRSSAGAMGLMQLMPATASQVARRAGLGHIDRASITTVDTNVSLGTHHLRELLDLLDNRPMLASAAYNAGLSRVREWQPTSTLEGAAYAETIPFSETRDYVKKVLSNTMHYARVLSQPFVPLKNRLGNVKGRIEGN